MTILRSVKPLQPPKKITQYGHGASELTEPETGHTRLLPSEEHAVITMDPNFDPELQWSGKTYERTIPILPLQRNEVITESRVRAIVERAKNAALQNSGQTLLSTIALERVLREKDRTNRVEFYKHEEKWKNKLICGDSSLVMESLLHYEGLKERVQMIYFDPPYGIKYDSNFQQRVDSTSNDEKDRADDIVTIKAFMDTWTLGVHSYLSYLQERLYLCRDLLSDSGSIFLQIGADNLPYASLLLDEVFKKSNRVAIIAFRKTAGKRSRALPSTYDYLLWYAKNITKCKYRRLYLKKQPGASGAVWYDHLVELGGRIRRITPAEREDPSRIPKGSKFASLTAVLTRGNDESRQQPFTFQGRQYTPGPDQEWKTDVPEGMQRLADANRLYAHGRTLKFVRTIDDFDYFDLSNVWNDTWAAGFTENKLYSVQTAKKVVDRCLLMATDPGDLVFDPTCGSGTTAFSAESWGRRWITCDTSRVAINVARMNLLSSTFKHYRTQNGEPSSGFIHKKALRTTLKSIAQNIEGEPVKLIDDPEIDESAIRVCGPFEMMTVGRYSIEDWKGYVKEGGKLENYISVICRLYRKDAAVQSANGLLHAICESQHNRIAISVGPISGRVTAKQISDVVDDAVSSGISEIHVLGWSFEPNVGEVKSRIESRGKVTLQLIMIRPDSLAEGLKSPNPEMLFSPFALPDVSIVQKENMIYVSLNGVAIFDRKTRSTEYKRADSGYVKAWYLDEDYDGDCFVDCQLFFQLANKKKFEKIAGKPLGDEDFEMQYTSRPFPIRTYRQVAVKVIDIYGNESTVVKSL